MLRSHPYFRGLSDILERAVKDLQNENSEDVKKLHDIASQIETVKRSATLDDEYAKLMPLLNEIRKKYFVQKSSDFLRQEEREYGQGGMYSREVDVYKTVLKPIVDFTGEYAFESEHKFVEAHQYNTTPEVVDAELQAFLQAGEKAKARLAQVTEELDKALKQVEELKKDKDYKEKRPLLFASKYDALMVELEAWQDDAKRAAVLKEKLEAMIADSNTTDPKSLASRIVAGLEAKKQRAEAIEATTEERNGLLDQLHADYSKVLAVFASRNKHPDTSMFPDVLTSGQISGIRRYEDSKEFRYLTLENAISPELLQGMKEDIDFLFMVAKAEPINKHYDSGAQAEAFVLNYLQTRLREKDKSKPTKPVEFGK